MSHTVFSLLTAAQDDLWQLRFCSSYDRRGSA